MSNTVHLVDSEIFKPFGKSIVIKHPDYQCDQVDSKIISGSVEIDDKESWLVRCKNGFEEELYFSNNILVWSRGNNFKYRELLYTYSIEDPIAYANFTEYPPNQNSEALESLTILDIALKIHVIDEKGGMASITLPFQVRSVWSVKGFGLIMEREVSEAEDVKLPYIYSFTHPYDDVTPIAVRSGAQGFQTINEPKYFKVVQIFEEYKTMFVFDECSGIHKLFKMTLCDTEFETNTVVNNKSKIYQTTQRTPTIFHDFSMMHISPVIACPSSIADTNLRFQQSTPHISKQPISANQFWSPSSSLFSNNKFTDTPAKMLRTPTRRPDNSNILFSQNKSINQARMLKPRVHLNLYWCEPRCVSNLRISWASKAFFTRNIFGEDFFCYIIPSQSSICLYKVSLKKFVSINSQQLKIDGRDAAYAKESSLLIVLTSEGGLCIYDGTFKLANLTLSQPLVDISDNNLFSSDSTENKSDRCTVLASSSPKAIPGFSTVELSSAFPVYLGLKQSQIGNRFFVKTSAATYVQAELPLLTPTKLINLCLSTICKCEIPQDIAYEFVRKWYEKVCYQTMEDDDYWHEFTTLLLSEFGIHDHPVDDDFSMLVEDNTDDSNSASSISCDQDWQFLLNTTTEMSFQKRYKFPCQNIPSVQSSDFADICSMYLTTKYARLLPWMTNLFSSLSVLYEDIMFDNLFILNRRHLLKLMYLLSCCLGIKRAESYYYYEANDVNIILKRFQIVDMSNGTWHSSFDVRGLEDTEFQCIYWICQILSNKIPERSFSYDSMRHRNIYAFIKCLSEFFPPTVCKALGVSKQPKSFDTKIFNRALSGSERANFTDLFALPFRIAELQQRKQCGLQSQNQIPNILLLYSNIDNFEDGMNHMTTSWSMSTKITQMLAWPLSVWPKDLRLREVRRCLQSQQPIALSSSNDNNSDNSSTAAPDGFTDNHHEMLKVLSHRAMCCPVGRALFTLQTLNPSPLDDLYIPLLCLKGVLDNRPTTLDLETVSPTLYSMNWPKFHNSIAAALALHPSVRPSMIDNVLTGNVSFSTLTESAGFMLGIGLNGGLKNPSPVSVFSVVVQCDEMCTACLLLGLGVSNHHSCSATLTRLMAIHVRSMILPTQAELEIQFLSQLAAMLGLGFLYAESYDERIAEVLLGEITGSFISKAETPALIDHETHSMCAALSLGLVLLGMKSRNVMKHWEDRLIDELGKLISYDDKRWNRLTVAGPACIALSLAFFDTNSEHVAQLLTPDHIQPLRPDLIFYTILGKSLIMWNTVSCTSLWVKSQSIRDNLHKGVNSENNRFVVEKYLYSMAAACYALGLKYAGTASSEASKVLFKQLNCLMKCWRGHVAEEAWFNMMRPPKCNFITYSLNFALCSIIISASMVLAGTGNLPLFRILRYLRMSAHPIRAHCVQFAVHMSIGMLFLGGGRLGFKSNDKFSLVCLLASTLPPFPLEPDQQCCVPQFLRHLYVLATEPRLLTICTGPDHVTADIDLRHINAKVHIQQHGCDQLNLLNDNHGVYRLPSLSTIKRICIRADGFWPIDLFEHDEINSELRSVLARDGLLILNRKSLDLALVFKEQQSLSNANSSLQLILTEIEKVVVTTTKRLTLSLNKFALIKLTDIFLDRLQIILAEMYKEDLKPLMMDGLRDWMKCNVSALISAEASNSQITDVICSCLKVYLLANDSEMRMLAFRLSQEDINCRQPIKTYNLLKIEDQYIPPELREIISLQYGEGGLGLVIIGKNIGIQYERSCRVSVLLDCDADINKVKEAQSIMVREIRSEVRKYVENKLATLEPKME
ncbi:hypothetical protein GJ496_003534 [Pomphorhynchus laevis]|nr:hypothetical protein GJ496_003534 [Pomphorhynchus laevis]